MSVRCETESITQAPIVSQAASGSISSGPPNVPDRIRKILRPSRFICRREEILKVVRKTGIDPLLAHHAFQHSFTPPA
jgi:hypothetical protein